jgi:hypothetical protein
VCTPIIPSIVSHESVIAQQAGMRQVTLHLSSVSSGSLDTKTLTAAAFTHTLRKPSPGEQESTIGRMCVSRCACVRIQELGCSKQRRSLPASVSESPPRIDSAIHRVLQRFVPPPQFKEESPEVT